MSDFYGEVLFSINMSKVDGMNVAEFIADIQQLAEEKGVPTTSMYFDFETDGLCYSTEHELSACRYETDDERQQREDRWAARRAEAEALLKQQRETEEREQYERLKRKFEGE